MCTAWREARGSEEPCEVTCLISLLSAVCWVLVSYHPSPGVLGFHVPCCVRLLQLPGLGKISFPHSQGDVGAPRSAGPLPDAPASVALCASQCCAWAWRLSGKLADGLLVLGILDFFPVCLLVPVYFSGVSRSCSIYSVQNS